MGGRAVACSYPRRNYLVMAKRTDLSTAIKEEEEEEEEVTAPSSGLSIILSKLRPFSAGSLDRPIIYKNPYILKNLR